MISSSLMSELLVSDLAPAVIEAPAQHADEPARNDRVS
jgi:hypothetical protein